MLGTPLLFFPRAFNTYQVIIMVNPYTKKEKAKRVGIMENSVFNKKDGAIIQKFVYLPSGEVLLVEEQNGQYHILKRM
jgi:hypothetical protein